MNTLEHDIFRYVDLSDAEQRAVEKRVAERPEYEALLAEVKQLEAELRRVRLPNVSEEGGESVPLSLLALYAIDRARSARASDREALQPFFEEVEARLAHDTDLQRRLQPMIDRAKELDDTFDVANHLQSVTGIDLEAVPVHDTSDSNNENDDGPSTTALGTNGHASVGTASSSRDSRGATPRKGQNEPPHRASGQVWRAARYAAMIAAVLLVAYGVLLGISIATQAPAERMAVLNPDEMHVEGYQVRTRSATAAPRSNDERFLQALEVLRASHSAPLGLFPQFNEAQVQEAQNLLTTVVDNEEAGSFLQLEASFFLAKTHLAQSEIEPARQALKRVVMGEGRRIDEATRMLESLQRHYPMEEPTLPEGAQL
ncbi:hypothetical protein CRI93_03455 [Longimonas halophila]|uniref:Uncharacterized protein n=1 Tax=Longimonas halophila TaxID=1469170 RepID=A0A2H3P9V1_9BACT|nr:hypothetical protein [Longimonas halophila]PEN08821.1 hypothetical protein CRI93_03455 [Longimonas halophila]